MKKDDNNTMPTPDDLDGQTLDEMAETIDEAITEELETIDDTGPDETRAEGQPEPEVLPPALNPFDEDQMSQILGNAIGGILDGYYVKIGARMITETECKNIGVAASKVMDKYLPQLFKRFPELMALGFTIALPTVLRLQELQFQKAREYRKAKGGENANKPEQKEPETDAAPDR